MTTLTSTTQRRKQVSKLTLDQVCDELRSKGFTVRWYGYTHQTQAWHGLAYEITSPDKGYAIRFESQMRDMLAGVCDPFFGVIA